MAYRGGNYSFVIDSSFQPFTMQEMLTPFVAYKEAFEKSEEAYTDLKTKADHFKYLADNLDPDSKAAQIYNGYAEELNAQATDLARNGLTMGNRRALAGLKQRYQGEIGRLYDAENLRKAQIAEQMKLLAQDPTRIFSRDAAASTLDDYLDNPDLSYKNYSGALLAQQVGTAASALASELRDKIKTGKLDEFTNTWIQSYGLEPSEVLYAIENPGSPGAGKTLNAIVHQAVESSGIPSWNNKNATDAAYRWAWQGVWPAVGKSAINTFKNERAAMNAEIEKQKILTDYSVQKQKALFDYKLQKQQEAARAAAIAAGGVGGIGGTTSAVINPSNIYSAEEAAAQNVKIKKYEKYFTKTADGRTVLNADGIKAYNTPQVISQPYSSGASVYNQTVPSDFKNFVDEIGGADLFKKKQYGNIGNLWNQFKSKDFTKYDATALTEYNHNLDSSEYANWKARIQERADGKLEKVKWDSKNKRWVADGKVSVKDAFKDDGNVTSTQSSIYGRTFRIVDKNGKMTRYRLPKGINSRAELNIDRHLQALSTVQELSKQLDSTGKKILTAAEADALNKATPRKIFTAGMTINAATLQAVSAAFEDALATFESQLGITNTNKPQEWSPINFGSGAGPSNYPSLLDDEE